MCLQIGVNGIVYHDKQGQGLAFNQQSGVDEQVCLVNLQILQTADFMCIGKFL